MGGPENGNFPLLYVVKMPLRRWVGGSKKLQNTFTWYKDGPLPVFLDVCIIQSKSYLISITKDWKLYWKTLMIGIGTNNRIQWLNQKDLDPWAITSLHSSNSWYNACMQRKQSLVVNVRSLSLQKEKMRFICNFLLLHSLFTTENLVSMAES